MLRLQELPGGQGQLRSSNHVYKVGSATRFLSRACEFVDNCSSEARRARALKVLVIRWGVTPLMFTKTPGAAPSLARGSRETLINGPAWVVLVKGDRGVETG